MSNETKARIVLGLRIFVGVMVVVFAILLERERRGSEPFSISAQMASTIMIAGVALLTVLRMVWQEQK